MFESPSPSNENKISDAYRMRALIGGGIDNNGNISFAVGVG